MRREGERKPRGRGKRRELKRGEIKEGMRREGERKPRRRGKRRELRRGERKHLVSAQYVVSSFPVIPYTMKGRIMCYEPLM